MIFGQGSGADFAYDAEVVYHEMTHAAINPMAGFAPTQDWVELKARLLDIHERRLAEMDAHGIELMLLSLNAPAVQAIPDRPTVRPTDRAGGRGGAGYG